MSNTVYEIIEIVLNLLGTYIIFCMMRLLNKSLPYNARFEFLSYVFASFINIILTKFITESWIIFIASLIAMAAFTLNYDSSIKTKIYSFLFVLLIMNLAEAAVVAFQSTPPNITILVPVNGSTIHMYLYCRVIEFTTLIFLIRLDTENLWIKQSFTKWSAQILIALIALLIALNIRIRELSQREFIFNFILTLYIIAAMIYLHITNQMKIEKDKKAMQEQINEYKGQYMLLDTSAHLIAERYYNMEPHFMVIRNLILHDEKEQAIAHLEKFIMLPEPGAGLIRSGNMTIDSILSAKFAQGQKEGIEIRHEIDIPPNMNIDHYDITSILAGLLNCAVSALMSHPSKKLFFSMRYEKNMVHIYMAHANTESDEERKRYRYIYRDDRAMKSVEKAVNKYSGTMESSIKEGMVIVSLSMILPVQAKMII